jgi:MFS transporter, DHA2 family, multidrug resistance protein
LAAGSIRCQLSHRLVVRRRSDDFMSEIPTPSAAPIELWQPRAHPWLIAAAVMSATFMVVLDSTVVAVALPHIAGNLSASSDEATWSLTSYLVANAIVLPATGWLGSMFGRKRLLLGCIAMFTLASVACGMANSLIFLIVARIIQGLGGGAMQPISQSVLLESFKPSKRGVAMAIFGMGVVVAPIIGPTLGGWITDNYSWRWVFYINVPVGLLAVMLVETFVEDPPYIRNARAVRIDLVGLVLLALWVGSLHIMLDKGQEEDWLASSFIRSLLVMTLLAFPIFVIWELRAKEPIVNLRILRDRSFLTGCALITVVGAVLYGATTLLPLFLQTLLGYPALQSGLAVSPRGLGSFVGMFVVGRLVSFVDNRLLLFLGFSGLAFSTFALGGLNLDIAPIDVIWPNIINGLSMGFIFVPLTTSAMGWLRNEQMANATGIYNLLRNIGAAAGIAMMTTFLARGAQVHQNVMVAHMTPYDSAYQQEISAVQSAFSPYQGTYQAGRTAEAVMGVQVSRQATLWAYVDDFRLLAIMALACIPGILLLRPLRHR